MYRILPVLLICFAYSVNVYAQTQRPVYLSQATASGSVKGYYELLPPDYSTSLTNYPLIIWVHGAGQGGQGNTADLPKVLEYGLPKMISQSGFPSSFTVNGNNFSFIVISPQFTTGWPNGTMLNGMITYLMNTYRIDPDRIYLMGMSAGGGAVWDYTSMNTTNSNRVGAIIPFCGAFSPTQAKANIIAAGKTPVWAFHNTNDGTVPVQHSRNWINYIKAYSPAYTPIARLTEFPIVSNNAVIAHDSWSNVIVPTYKPDGINIYEWMLQYKRRSSTANAAPNANAGNDQGIVSPAILYLNGTASSDPDGVIVSYRWRKTAGTGTYSFLDSTKVNTTVQGLSPGTHQFQLTVTDNLGASSTDNVTVNVYPSIPPGAQQRVLIDVGSSTSMGGSTTSSPNINGYTWNNMTSALPGIRVSNAVSIANTPTGISLEVINRLDGTFSTGSSGVGHGNNSVTVNEYPGSATTDHALVHSSAANGKWRIYGLNPAKVYVIKFWGARTNTSAARSIEIKRSDDNLWVTYNATNNTNFNNAAVFNISGKSEMIFDIRTKSGSDFSCINIIDITFSGDESPVPPNNAPVSDAGPDLSVTLPVNSVTLNGCNSTDPENGSLIYQWRKISGPAVTINSGTQCNAVASSLSPGTYMFELQVTDNGSLIDKDSAILVVNAAVQGNQPPVANAGADLIIQLPVTTASLNGCSSADPESGSLIFNWTKVSGPNVNLSAPALCNTDLNSLVNGIYLFELTVSDPEGLTDKDSVMITVNNNTPPANTPPVANAGSDQTIQLPTNKIFADGRNSTDVDGTINSYQWAVLSGPSGSIINTPYKDTTTITLVNPGTYSIRLVVSDNNGGSHADDMIVMVQAAQNEPEPPSTQGRSLRVNIFGGSNGYNNAAWNNWNVVQGAYSSNFKYEDGSLSSINAMINTQAGIADNGNNYASAAVSCPGPVLRHGSYNTSMRYLQLRGLEPSKTYSMEFYGSRANSGNRTVVNINNINDTINTDNNLNDFASFSGVSAEINGTLTINLWRIGTYNYLSGFIIREELVAGRSGEIPEITSVRSPDITLQEGMITYPNPFYDFIRVTLDKEITIPFTLTITDISGKILINRSVKNEQDRELEINTAILGPGIYILSLQSKDFKKTSKIIKR